MKHNDLKYQAFSGAKWSGGSVAYTSLVQFVTTAILAHILSPSDFGLVGMMTIVVGLIGVLSDAGISGAIIYRQDATREQLSTLYWINISAGIMVFIVIVLSRPLAVVIFKEPRLSTYLPWIASSFLISPIGQQFSVLLRKELNFKTLTKIDVGAVTISSVAAVVIALCGCGIWSLVFWPVAQTVISASALFLVGVRHRWLPVLYFNAGCVKEYMRFGLFQMGEGLVNTLYANIDYLVIGRFLGPDALGFYTLAYNLVTVPLTKVNPVVTRVAFPIFAKTQFDDEKLRNGFLKMIRYISTCSFPMMAGMFIVAPVFVPVVYGQKWFPAVAVLQVLCASGVLFSLGNPVSSLLLSKGRADIGFYFNIFACVLMSIGNLIGVRWGIVGVAWSLIITAALILWPVEFYIRWRLVKMKVTEYFASFRIPAIGSGLMIMVLWSTSPLWNQMSNIWSLILQTIVGASFYCLITWTIAKPFCMELKANLLRTR